MSVNYVEDALISDIDRRRSGVDPEAEAELRAQRRQSQALFIRLIELTIIGGAKFPGYSDAELEEMAQSVSLLEAAELESIELLCRRTGLSRRRLRALPEGDHLRQSFERRMDRIRELEDRRTELLGCANDRRYLQNNPEVIEKYFRAKFNRRNFDAGECMSNLRNYFFTGAPVLVEDFD